MQPHDKEAIRRKLASLAWLLDSSIPLPGAKFRIGIDALIGLIPALGDLVGVALSTYIVREAARVGAPKSLLARMAFNIAVEGVVGMVPLLGDIFDAAWKANQRNVALLEAWLANPVKARRTSRVFVFGVMTSIVAVFIATGVGTFMLVRWVWQAFAA